MSFTIFMLQKVLRTKMLRCELLYTHSLRGVIHDLKEHQNSALKRKSILEDEAVCTSALISENDLMPRPFYPTNKKYTYVPRSKKPPEPLRKSTGSLPLAAQGWICTPQVECLSTGLSELREGIPHPHLF